MVRRRFPRRRPCFHRPSSLSRRPQWVSVRQRSILTPSSGGLSLSRHVLGLPYWSLAGEALRVHLDVPFDQVRLVSGVLELGEHRIEVGRESYIDHRRARPPFSLENLTRGSELPARARPLFENAIVLVGPNGPGVETLTTPMHASIPRFFVDASDLATLLNGRIRRDVPRALEILLVWVLALVGATVFLRGSPGTGFLIWAMGWGGLLLLFWLPFVGRDGPRRCGPRLRLGAHIPDDDGLSASHLRSGRPRP